jgi:hypothetical protein
VKGGSARSNAVMAGDAVDTGRHRDATMGRAGGDREQPARAWSSGAMNSSPAPRSWVIPTRNDSGAVKCGRERFATILRTALRSGLGVMTISAPESS